LDQVGDLFELNIKLRCQNVKLVFHVTDFRRRCVIGNTESAVK